MFLCSYRFDFYQKGLNRTPYILRGEFDRRIIYAYPCTRLRIAPKLKKVLILLIHLADRADVSPFTLERFTLELEQSIEKSCILITGSEF